MYLFPQDYTFIRKQLINLDLLQIIVGFVQVLSNHFFWPPNQTWPFWKVADFCHGFSYCYQVCKYYCSFVPVKFLVPFLLTTFRPVLINCFFLVSQYHRSTAMTHGTICIPENCCFGGGVCSMFQEHRF